MTANKTAEIRCEAFVGRIGREEFDSLVEAMLDLAVAPFFLDGERAVQLTAPRDYLLGMIRRSLATEPDLSGCLFGDSDYCHFDFEPALVVLAAAVTPAYSTVTEGMMRRSSAGSRVLSQCPELVSRIDGDGLVDLDSLQNNPQAFIHGEYALHYHQFLRRGFSSHINYPLISFLIAMREQAGCRIRIALDERRLRWSEDFIEVFEFDRWFGPKLNSELLDDPAHTGETVHIDPDEGTGLLNPYAALQVRWSADARIKTCQIEEVVPHRSDRFEPVYVRYLHAERDVKRGEFIHLDGAVKRYPADEYPLSPYDLSLLRKTKKRKVFRLDGAISAESFSEICALWFRGNKLMPEYLAALC